MLPQSCAKLSLGSEILDIFFREELHIVYMARWGWGWGHVSLHVVNVTWVNLDPLAFTLHF
jgi:hypothetical protein